MTVDRAGTGRASSDILHVDMDAFYASVEVLDDPTLAGQAVIVGGIGRRGVVASCSYEARRFGVRSAMPTSQARQRCPNGTYLPGRFERYGEVSRALHDVFEAFSPLVEPIALDEAFLDVRGVTRLFGPPRAIAEAIRARVLAELGLSCSVGVGPSKMIAKLASEAAKPTVTGRGVSPGPGVVVVEAEGQLAFLHPLPVRALWGVGPATAERLRRLGVLTVGQLAAIPASTLETAVGRAAGRHLALLAQGIDDRPVVAERPLKSVGHEETYAHDRFELADLHREVVRMSDSIADRARKAGVGGRTVTLKVRWGDFTTITRSRTVTEALCDGPAIARVAAGLLEEVDLTPGVRLLGVSISNLSGLGAEAGLEQLRLGLDPPAPESAPTSPARRRAVAGALDAVRDRYGRAAVGPAALLGEDGLAVKGPGVGRWGPDGSR
jgi:DNA polymerase-4